MSASRDVTIPALRGVSITGTSIDTKANKTYLTFKKEGTSGMDTKGSYELFSGNEKINATFNGNTITISGIWENARSYTLKYIYTTAETAAEYTTSSNSYKVPAYTRPRNLNVKFNDTKRIVEVT